MFETVLERCLDVVYVGGEAGQRIFEAVTVLPAPNIQLLSILSDLLLRLRREGVHQLLQHTELFAAEKNTLKYSNNFKILNGISYHHVTEPN